MHCALSAGILMDLAYWFNSTFGEITDILSFCPGKRENIPEVLPFYQ